MITREKIANAKRWVVKIGSALLTEDGKGLSPELLSGWVAQVAALRNAGHEMLIVSSGAVAEGMSRMGWQKRPHNLNELQAAAAIGQMGLVHAWEACFQEYGLHTAQILLTRDDLADRSRYLNARSTLRTLLELGVVPVVNENDTVAIDEIRFGDNDTLAALVANLIEADLLVILTDVDAVRVTERKRHQRLVRCDFNQRHIRKRIPADDFCGVIPAIGQYDLNVRRLLDNVVVGQDMTILVDNKSGPQAVMPEFPGQLLPEESFEKILQRIVRSKWER